METKDFTDEDRAAVARGWASSGETQAAYAARCGISARTLRQYLVRYAPTAPSMTDVLEVLDDAISRLSVFRDAALAAACRPAHSAGLPAPHHGGDGSAADPAHREAEQPPHADAQRSERAEATNAVPDRGGAATPNSDAVFSAPTTRSPLRPKFVWSLGDDDEDAAMG